MTTDRSLAWTTALSRRAAIGTVGAVAAGAALTPLTCAQDSTPLPAQEMTEEGKKTFYMFTQTATSGSFRPKPGEPGVFQVTLEGVTDQTVYYSGRPGRIVGTLPTEEFLDGLGFAPENPPNAAIVAQTDQGEDILVVELLNPRFDTEAGTLTYDVLVLDDYQDDGLGHLAQQQRDDQLAESFGHTSLFIDDCPDLTTCSYRDEWVGPIPGGPYGQCWHLFSGCQQTCSGQPDAYYQQLCNEAYPSCNGDCRIRASAPM